MFAGGDGNLVSAHSSLTGVIVPKLVTVPRKSRPDYH